MKEKSILVYISPVFKKIYCIQNIPLYSYNKTLNICVRQFKINSINILNGVEEKSKLKINSIYSYFLWLFCGGFKRFMGPISEAKFESNIYAL